MFKEIDRNKLRSNVLYYAKLKGLKIGEIERTIGRRAGYIARWGRTETISVEDLYNIALILDTTIDNLINEDIEEKLILEEIEKLKQKIHKIEEHKQQQIVNIEQQIQELENRVGE